MNVLHLNDNYQIKGGTEVYIHQLQQLLPEFGVNSFFIGVSFIIGQGFTIETINYSKKGLQEKEAFDFIISFVNENKIDLLHLHGISDPNLVKLCLILRPVIRSMHEPRLFCPGNQKFWLKSENICTKPFGKHCLVHAFTQRCASIRPNNLINNYSNVKFEIDVAAPQYKFILAMSEYVKSEAICVGISSDNIVVNPYFTTIHNDIDFVDEFVPDKVKHIVFAGRLHASKGAHLLIKAMQRIFLDYEDVVLDIIGDGDFKNELLSLIKQLEIPSDKIIFHGWLNHHQTIEHIKKSYLLAFPSIYPEAFGIVGIEAMMCSKPIVAFDVGGVSTWLKDKINGFLVENKNVDIFAEKIKILLNNENIYSQFSNKSRELALKNFLPEIHIDKLVTLYRKCV